MTKQNEELTLNDKIKFDSKGGAILGILEGPVADFIHDTRNGRHYSEELWEKVMKNPLVQEQFKNGGIVGELDHPADREDICTEKVAVIMPEPPVKKNGKYWGKFNILDTPCGRIVHTLAKAGFKLGVSSRGTGDVDEYTNEVDPNTYDFTCFDVVLLPAVKDARMTLVTEGLDIKKPNVKKLLKESIDASSDADKKIMKDTLNHIGINMEEEIEKKKCVICGKEFEGYGNNASPVKDGLCCDECNTKVVIPARLKDSQLKEETGDKEKEEKKENPKEESAENVSETEKPVEIHDEKEIVEPETIDDIEIEKEDQSKECEVDDAKLIDFLHEFLKEQGFEIEGDGQEEERFVQLYHEMVCPECTDQADEKSVDKEEAPEKEPEVDDVEFSELIEQLQNALKENKGLKEEIQNLQTEKAVSGAKVSKLTEELGTFKSIAASAGKKVLETKDLESKSAELSKQVSSLQEKIEKQGKQSELYESRIANLISSKQDQDKRLSEAAEKVNKLTESINSLQTTSSKQLKEANESIEKSKKLAEKYKGIAHDAANRYIERRALGMGISKNEILNRLDESYSLDDVDRVCKDLEGYSLNISKLPFALEKSGSVKMQMRENKSKTPLKNVMSEYDDEVDDYLLDLAGLK